MTLAIVNESSSFVEISGQIRPLFEVTFNQIIHPESADLLVSSFGVHGGFLVIDNTNRSYPVDYSAIRVEVKGSVLSIWYDTDVSGIAEMAKSILGVGYKFSIPPGVIKGVDGSFYNYSIDDSLSSPITTPTYRFIEGSGVMNEGQSNGLLLQTNGVAAGTEVSYTISGIDSSRIAGGSLTGTVVVDTQGQAIIQLPILANQRTDGPTTAVVSVANGAASYSVQVNDTSVSYSTTPTYRFIEGSGVMNEGQSNGLLLQTNGVAAGTEVSYTISGIDSSRIAGGSLTGTVVVDTQGQAIIQLPILANQRTDGPTTAVVSVANGAASYSVQVNDTSVNGSSFDLNDQPEMTDSGSKNSNVSNATTGYFGLTGDAVIDATTHGYKWDLGSNRTIDIAVANGFSGEYWNNIEAIGGNLKFATDLISYYTDVKFNYLGAFSNPSEAYNAGSEITLSLDGNNKFFTSNQQWGKGFFPDSTYNITEYQGAPGDFYLNINSAANSLPSYEPGSDGWFLLIHELGHTLGLKHPHDDGGTGRPTYENLGAVEFDRDWTTIMSYKDFGSWNASSWDPATPMIMDVYALQYLYGKNINVNSGDDIFTVYEDGLYKTIWDPSGNDTINLSTNDSGWSVVLPEESLSTIVDTKAGYAMPTQDEFLADNGGFPYSLTWLAGDFENVIGSNYADSIIGNLFDNIISGGGGNDVIDGGKGFDVCVYSGSKDQYIIDLNQGTVADKLSYRDGFDVLSNVERLKFSDSSVALDSEGTAGQAYRLYKAAFDRIPDEGGLGYWINHLDNGASLSGIASMFVGSKEFQAMYGENCSNDTFVELLYNNVLHRDPDSSGNSYWLNAMEQGMCRGDVLACFSESAENINQTADLIATGIHYQEWLG